MTTSARQAQLLVPHQSRRSQPRRERQSLSSGNLFSQCCSGITCTCQCNDHVRILLHRPGAKVTNGQVHHIETVSKDDDAIKPSAPVPPRPVSVSTPIPGDNHIPVPAGVMSNHASHNRDELHQLWSQFCVAMDTCISTVTPLFLTMILALYLVSAVTKSQTIASIGLVYVFVFLMLLFSYFAAIVPFILVSNAICSSMAPTGKSPQKDFIRLSVLMCSIGVVVGYVKYGKTVY
jgi:hypothetical protein